MAATSDGIPTTFFRLYDGASLVCGTVGDIMPPDVGDDYNVGTLLDGNSITGELPGSTDHIRDTVTPCLTLTTRAGRCADFRVDARRPHPDQVAAIVELIRHLESYAATSRAANLAILFLPESNRIVADAIASRGYNSVVLTENYHLDIMFASFEEYLARFSSARRNAIRREVRYLASDSDVRVEIKPLAEGTTNHVELGFGNLVKYEGVGPDARERIARRSELIIQEFGNSARVIELWMGRRCVASLQFTELDSRIYARFWGQLSGLPPRLAAYFQLCYYQLIPLALAEGMVGISYGFAMGYPKLSRGCHPEPMRLWLQYSPEAIFERLRLLSHTVRLPSMTLSAAAEDVPVA